MLDQDYLREILEYDEATGIFRWKWRDDKSNLWNSKYPGKVAGSLFISQHGMRYIRIKFDSKNYMAHRLAWLYVYGELVPMLDHWDGNGLNNSIANLRPTTDTLNRANDNRLNRGVDKIGNKYRAKITIESKQIHLGMFATRERAQEVYIKAHVLSFGDYSVYRR